MTEQNGLERSSATERISAMLDERGVEWWEDAFSSEHRMVFDGKNGVRYCVYQLGFELFISSVLPITPEQAVEATLGSDLKAENEKLRELVLHMHTCLEHYEPGDTISCKHCPYDNETWGCDYERIMAELGIEVDA